MIKNKGKIIMAESSDIFHDGRVLKQAQTLTEDGYKVLIYGFRNQKTKRTNYPFKIISFPIFSKKYIYLRKTSIIINILLINIILLFKKSDFYHSHNTMFLPSMYLANKIFRGKLIYDSHEVQWELNFISKILEFLFIKKADKVINVSKGRADAQISRYGLNPKIVTVISNYPKPSEDINYRSLNNNFKLNIVFSGGFDLSDNKLDNLVLAMKQLKDCKLFLMAFGYGQSEEKIKKIIKSNNLTDRIEFIPLVKPSQVVNQISKYDIAVNFLVNPKNLISYKYHGINKMYEYLHAGLPILCSEMPSFKNDFEKNNVGKCVDVFDIKSIIDGINFFMNYENLKTMKQLSRKVAYEKFNWSSEKIKLKKLYNNILCVE